MSKRKERTPAQRELDIVRIVELKRARRTSEEIAEILNGDGRDEASRIAAPTVRAQYLAFMKRLAEKNETDGEKDRKHSIREHEIDRAEALRHGADFARAGNPSAPSFFMVAHRCQLALDRLRGVQPRQQEGKGAQKCTCKPGQVDNKGCPVHAPFETRESAVTYLTEVGGLGGRVLPYADTRRKKK